MLEKAVVELAELRPSFVSVTYGALGQHPRAHARRRHPHQPRAALPGHAPPHLRGPHPGRHRRAARPLRRQRGREHPRPRRRPARRRLRPRRRLRARLASSSSRCGPTRPASRSAWPPTPRSTPARPTGTSDRRHLAAKLEAADFAMTQFFFSIDDYLRLVDELAELGCDKPVLPGVMPFINVAGLVRMAGMNGSVIPGAAPRAPATPSTDQPEEVAQDRRRGGHRARRRPPRRGRPRPPPLRPQPQRVGPADPRQPRPRLTGSVDAALAIRALASTERVSGASRAVDGGVVGPGDGTAVGECGGRRARTKRWPLCSHSSVTMAAGSRPPRRRATTSWCCDDRLDVDPRPEADVGGQHVVGVAQDPAGVGDALVRGRAAASSRTSARYSPCLVGVEAVRREPEGGAGHQHLRRRRRRVVDLRRRRASRAGRAAAPARRAAPPRRRRTARPPRRAARAGRRRPAVMSTAVAVVHRAGGSGARIVPRSSQSRPQAAAGGWQR